MDIVTFIFNVLVAISYKIMTFILIPIDNIISENIPDLATAFDAIAQFIILLFSSLAWAIDATGIPYSAISLIALYYIFVLTAPVTIWFIKLFLNWYKTIKG